MRYVLALIVFIMTSTNAMASQIHVSFQGMITEAACTIRADHGNIHSTCARKNERHASSFHVSSAERQHFALPGNLGSIKVKWLNEVHNKGLLLANYR